MKNKLIFASVIIGFGIILIYTMSGSNPPENYVEKIQKERSDKDYEFRNAEDSPLTEEQKAHFKNLPYFPIDENLRIKAKLQVLDGYDYFDMDVSNGSKRKYLRYAYATFEISGTKQKVTIFKPAEEDAEDYLFLPFFDETSANETYGGGRFLEPEITAKNTLEIDFNTAYNPYCAYNHNYRCPIPPIENKLTVPIYAGEKKADFNH